MVDQGTVPWQPEKDGLAVILRVTPKGGRDRLDGIVTDSAGRPALKIRVAAPPEDGKANAAVCALLAKAFGVAKSAVRITRGELARDKRALIEGDAGSLAKTAERLFGRTHDGADH